MRTASAMVLESPRRFVRRQMPLPKIGEDDGLLRVEACGLCGTDHEEYRGILAASFAFVPGHESVGIVEELGDSAAERWGVSQGDRVAVAVFQACRACKACSRGDYRHCRRHGLADMYGFVDVMNEPGLWGGYASHQYLAPDSVLLRVPDGLDPVTATLFNPLGAGIEWAARLPGTKEGDVVAVLGPGVRGLSALVAARAARARFVMVTGCGSNDAPRLETARQFGANAVIDVTVADPVTELRNRSGTLADVVVDVTANAPEAFAQAVKLARPGGTVVVAGTRGAADAPGFHPDEVVLKELRVQGALGVDPTAYGEALKLLASSSYPFDELPREVATLDTLESLLQTMAGESGRVPPLHGVVVP